MIDQEWQSWFGSEWEREKTYRSEWRTVREQIRSGFPPYEGALTDAGFITVNGILSLGPPRSVPIFLKKFGEQPWLRAATHLVAQDMAALKWSLYQPLDGDPGPDGKMPQKLITSHPLLSMWRRPNPRMTGYVFRYLLQVFLELAGEAPVLIERDKRTRAPKHLWPLPPHWLTQIPTQSRPYFQIWLNGQYYQVPPGEIIFIHHPNPLSPYGRGLGNAQCVADEVNSDEQAAEWNEAFWRNGAKPGGILMLPGLTPKDVERVRVQWEAEHQTVWRAFRTAFLGNTIMGAGGASSATAGGTPTYIDLHKSQRDMDFVEGRKQLRDIIIQAGWQIPPEKLGIVEDSNRATAEIADAIYQKNVLKPRTIFLEEEVNTWLVPSMDALFLLSGETGLILAPEDPVQESKRWLAENARKNFVAGLITRNEGRFANNMAPDPQYGDLYFIPMNGVFTDGKSPSGKPIQDVIEDDTDVEPEVE